MEVKIKELIEERKICKCKQLKKKKLNKVEN